MLKFYKRTIKGEFFVTGLTSVLIISMIFIALTLGSVYMLRLENARQTLKTANLHIATYTDGVLESLVMSAKTNAAFPGAMDYDSDNYPAQSGLLQLFAATTRANPNIKYSFAGYEDGSLLIEGYVPPVGYDARLRPWYTSAVERYPDISVGLPYQDAKTQEWLVSVSLAMVDEEGQLMGVMAVDCTLEYVKSLMLQATYFDSQTNYVLDKNRQVFVHKNSDFLHQSVDTIVLGLSQQFSADSGFIHYNLEGTKRLAYYQILESSDWIIVSAIDVSEVTAPIIVMLIYSVIGLVFLSVVLAIGQVKLYEKRFVRPINLLRDHIEELTLGKDIRQINTHYSYSNSELAEIASRIVEMAKKSLKKKTDDLKLILDATSDAILVLSVDAQVIHMNSKYADIQADLSRVLEDEPMTDRLFSRKEILDMVYLEDGQVLEQYTCPVLENGELIGQLWRYRDVTDRVRAEENLKKLATTDELTGLWNRRYFLERGVVEVGLIGRTGLPLSLLFIDLDYFKLVNDTYGHMVGDDVLRCVANVLRNSVRSTDLVARLGGEEFCVLLPNTHLDAAILLAEKLRAYFDAHACSVGDEQIRCTISVGVATYTWDNNGSFEDLLAKADQACYQAKDNGRNCVAYF